MMKRTLKYIVPLMMISLLIPSMNITGMDTRYDGLPDEELSGAVNGVDLILNKTNVPDTLSNNGPRKDTIRDGDTIYHLYTWMNNSKATLTIVVSKDAGSNWSYPLDIWRDTTTRNYDKLNFIGLYIWKDQIFAIFMTSHSNRNYRATYVMKAPISNWRSLSSATPMALRTWEAGMWDVTSDDNYLYFAMIRSGQWQGYLYRYDNTSWYSRTITGFGDSSRISIHAIQVGGSTRLLCYSARNYYPGYATGYLEQWTSTNSGTSWSSKTTVMDRRNDHAASEVIYVDGRLLAFATFESGDDIDMAISYNNGSTWSAEITLVADRGINTLENSNSGGFTVGIKKPENTIMMTYETSSEEIEMIHSNDLGETWLQESKAKVLHDGPAFNPTISEDGTLLSTLVDYGGTYNNIELLDINDVVVGNYAPSNLSINSDYLQLQLRWDPPKDEFFNKYTFNGYRLYRGASADSLSFFMNLGNVTTYTDIIPDFNQTRYFYGVRSGFATLDESGFSNIVNDMPIIPDPPQNLEPVPGDFQVSLSWDAPVRELTDFFPVRHYNVYRGNYPDALLEVAETSDITYIDTDIDRYPARYYYRVSYTLDTVGEGKMSGLIYSKPNTLPGVPTDIRYDEISGGYNLKWKAPLDTGCCPILSYNIYRGNHTNDMELLASQPGMNLDQTGMEAGSSYYYSISSVNRLGEGMLTEPVLINYLGTASSPESFMATGMDSKIELNWDVPRVTWSIPIDSYYIYRRTATRNLYLYQTLDGDVTEYTDFVINGIDYMYEISAVNTFGESDRAGPVSARATTIPGQVTDIMVGVGNMSVRLDWEPPVDDGGAALTHYSIYRSFDIETPSRIAKVASGLETFFDAPLTNGVTYIYFVSASNGNGEGALSDPISATPGTEPFAVTQISAAPLLYSGRITWQYPETGGRDIVKFVVYRGDSIRSLQPHMEVLPDMSLFEDQIIDKELTYGQRYFYAVTSENQFGESVLSPIVSMTPYGAPSEPKIVDVEEGLDEFTIGWAHPEDDGRMPILGYRFYYRIQGYQEWETIDLEELLIRIPNLDAGDTYEIQVTAYNQLAEGPASETILIELGDVPDKMALPTIASMNAACEIKWIEPEDNGHAVTGYKIYIVDEKGFDIYLDSVEGSVNSYIASDLLNGVEYTFRISAVNMKGESEMTDQVSVVPMTIPGIPKVLYLESSGDGFADIAWSAPFTSGGSQITEYNIYRGNSQGLEVLIDTVEGSMFTYSDRELQNGLTYYYIVKAVNEIGEGGASNGISATPLAPPSGVIDLKISATTDTVTIKWVPPTDNGGSPVIGYVLYKGTEITEMEVIAYLEPTEISFIDEDVETGTYHYSIQAYNKEGMGEPVADSVEVPARTPTTIVIGSAAFLIPLIIGILAVIIPLMIASSKRKKEKMAKEALEREELEKKETPPPAGPPLPGTTQQKPSPQLQPAGPMPPQRTLPPAQIPQQPGQNMMRAPSPANLQTPQNTYTSQEATYQRPEN